MKKQTKQLVVFVLAILLVIGWAMWPRSLERRILKHHAATDFSTVEQFQVLWTPPNPVRDYDAGAYPSWTLEEELTQPILDILEKYQVKTCYYGHLHGGSHRLAIQGERGGVAYRLISADFLKFRPEKIME